MYPWDGRTNQGPVIQNITDSIVAVIIEFGGHHTDLMYRNDEDPKCVTEARLIEKELIGKWVSEWQEEKVDPLYKSPSIEKKRLEIQPSLSPFRFDVT